MREQDLIEYDSVEEAWERASRRFSQAAADSVTSANLVNRWQVNRIGNHVILTHGALGASHSLATEGKFVSGSSVFGSFAYHVSDLPAFINLMMDIGDLSVEDLLKAREDAVSSDE